MSDINAAVQNLTVSEAVILPVVASPNQDRPFHTLCRADLVSDIIKCCFLERAAAAVDAALQCIIQMSASSELQVRFNHLELPMTECLAMQLHPNIVDI